MRIAIGMSGGVDSSVAAMLLKQQGHEIIGVCMTLWDGDYAPSTGKHGCYGPEEREDVEDAAKVCDFLGIPFYTFDCAAEYKKIVLEYFRSEYAAGRTPNPCVKCNQTMKFGFLPQKLHEAGLRYDGFATGHYARVEFNEELQRYLLKRGVDPRKDQTYFIYRLSQEQLSRCIFPLGGMTKEEVRKLAIENRLPTARKAESQDFYCGDYQDLLRDVGSEPGNIVDTSGKVLGQHDGIRHFTPGQRKGLNISSPHPLYVVEIDAPHNRVIIGNKEEIITHEFTVTQLNWIAWECPPPEFNAEVKIRSAQTPFLATMTMIDADTVNVRSTMDITAVAPGQSAVVYDGDIVLGGGIINAL